MSNAQVATEPQVFEVNDLAGAPSWVFGNDTVSLALTRSGGQLAPVTFYREDETPVQPYYVAPWSNETYPIPADEAVLKLMRGDVFCLPFGFPSEDATTQYRLHGDIASSEWRSEGARRADGVSAYSFSTRSAAPAGSVKKTLHLIDGHNAIYSRHTVSGVSGDYPVGHHPMLSVPSEEGAVLVAVGPSASGHTWPDSFGVPTEPAYAALAVNATFDSPKHAPTIFADAPFTAVDSFPAREGYTDALLWRNTGESPIAWSAATYSGAGYLWYSLKDPTVFPMTIVFMGNGGRHFVPWSGRERILSLQDVCGYFGTGVVRSRESNSLTEAGSATTVTFSSDAPTSFNHIQGVVRTPVGFGRVSEARFSPGAVTFVDETGMTVEAAVAHEFLAGGPDALAQAEI